MLWFPRAGIVTAYLGSSKEAPRAWQSRAEDGTRDELATRSLAPRIHPASCHQTLHTHLTANLTLLTHLPWHYDLFSPLLSAPDGPRGVCSGSKSIAGEKECPSPISSSIFLCSYRKKDVSGWRVTVPSRRQRTATTPMSIHLPTASHCLQDALDKYHRS